MSKHDPDERHRYRGELSNLNGLGPKSEQWLNASGIYHRQQLEDIGPVEAFLRQAEHLDTKPSLNLLYAMVGALEGRHWSEIAREEKAAAAG